MGQFGPGVERKKLIRPGHPGDDLERWPPMLRRLVREHGAGKVHQAGLERIGYPPDWAHSTFEGVQVAEALKKRN